MLIRGGQISPWLIKPDGDTVWSEADWGRAASIEARWKMEGVTESERRILVPCEVWRAKFPGMIFNDAVTKRLSELSVSLPLHLNNK